MINNEELPIGFTMELAQHSDALIRFSNMPEHQKQSVIEGAKQVSSRQEMRNYVEQLNRTEVTGYEQEKFS